MGVCHEKAFFSFFLTIFPQKCVLNFCTDAKHPQSIYFLPPVHNNPPRVSCPLPEDLFWLLVRDWVSLILPSVLFLLPVRVFASLKQRLLQKGTVGAMFWLMNDERYTFLEIEDILLRERTMLHPIAPHFMLWSDHVVMSTSCRYGTVVCRNGWHDLNGLPLSVG